jgi:hypothetical protein
VLGEYAVIGAWILPSQIVAFTASNAPAGLLLFFGLLQCLRLSTESEQ